MCDGKLADGCRDETGKRQLGLYTAAVGRRQGDFGQSNPLSGASAHCQFDASQYDAHEIAVALESDQ